jgi:hypothetical protein
MTIKFILTKFIEMTIKTFTILFFIFSVLLWMFFALTLLVYAPDMRFLQSDNCRSLGASWDQDLKICNWFYGV